LIESVAIMGNSKKHTLKILAISIENNMTFRIRASTI